MYTFEMSKTKYTIHALVPGNKCHTNGGRGGGGGSYRDGGGWTVNLGIGYSRHQARLCAVFST